MNVNVSNVIVRTCNGDKKSLGSYRGQVLLIVNVASQCGFTKQYAGLQKLQETYYDKGFQVLGFPCNDFGNQEPGELEEIKKFCSISYGAKFQLFQKVHARGNTTEPFTTLNQVSPAGDVEWNFEKFLINKDGSVAARFKSGIEPSSAEIINAISTASSSCFNGG